MNLNDRKEQAKIVMRLREKGYTFQEIGDQLELSKQRAYQIYSGYESMMIKKEQKKEPAPNRREKILHRDNNECQFCFGHEDLEVHHMDRNRKNNESRNLITLCYKCHSMLHRTANKK